MSRLKWWIISYLSWRDHREMIYWTRTVSLSIKTISGTRFIVDLSSSLISKSTVQSFKGNINILKSIWISNAYLSVKWVKLELIDTLECLRVDLLESDPVLAALEDVDLLHDVQPTLGEVALPGNCHLGLIIPLGGLLILCVWKYNKRDPELKTNVSLLLQKDRQPLIPYQCQFAKGCLKIAASSDCDVKV